MVTELHGVAVDLSYWLSGMHVLAAVCHRLRCDGVWSAMTSVWKETPNSFRDKDARWDFVDLKVKWGKVPVDRRSSSLQHQCHIQFRQYQ